MKSLSSARKGIVRQLVACSGATESQAIKALKENSWSLEAAADAFFAEGGGAQSSVDSAKITKLFDDYKEPGAETIQVGGVERFCKDLKVEPSDPILLLISWRMKAATMCIYTREEWTRGMTEMGVDSIEGLRSIFGELRLELDDPAAFRSYYVWCFGFCKEPNFGVRTLPTEVAMQMWELTLDSRFPRLALWGEFLANQKVRAVTKDVWDMLYEFATGVDENLSDYDEDGAWPVLIDEFVDFLRERLGLAAEGS